MTHVLWRPVRTLIVLHDVQSLTEAATYGDISDLLQLEMHLTPPHTFSSVSATQLGYDACTTCRPRLGILVYPRRITT